MIIILGLTATPHPPKKSVQRLKYPMTLPSPMSILLSITPPPLPDALVPPALLMTPRQEAELACGTEAIFPPSTLPASSLCQCLSLKPRGSESQWDTPWNYYHFNQTEQILKKNSKTSACRTLGAGLNFKHAAAWSLQIQLRCIEGDNTKQTLNSVLTAPPFRPYFSFSQPHRPVCASAQCLSVMNHWKVFTRPQDVWTMCRPL